MPKTMPPKGCFSVFLCPLLVVALASCTGYSKPGSSNGGGGGGSTPPSAPTGLSATATSAQVSLAWIASTGATGYNVRRATVTGGPYTTISSASATMFADTGLVNGSTYYYVVSALNSAGESANSSQVSGTPIVSTAIQVTVDVLSDRQAISPYVYGINFPSSTSYIQDTGATLIRGGGNASSRYNWKNFDTNAAADWYFSNRSMGSALLYEDSTQFVSSVKNSGAFPLMTMPLLPWVAKDGTSYSFSMAKYGPQCQANPYISDDGNGVRTDCQTNISGNAPNDADVPLLDTSGSGDPVGSIYRDQWIAALSSNFGATPHFYDMDNEPTSGARLIATSIRTL